MILDADLHKSINAVWDASNLDTIFQAYWRASADPDEFIVFHDGEAEPGTPFPYCVYEISEGNTTCKMSGHTKNERHEIYQIPVKLKIHTRSISGRSAKDVAIELLEEVVKIFGGHPTVVGGTFTLDNGTCIQTTYQNSFGEREGADEYIWHVMYDFLLDVPVAS